MFEILCLMGVVFEGDGDVEMEKTASKWDGDEGTLDGGSFFVCDDV